jgi:hypothetical protein
MLKKLVVSLISISVVFTPVANAELKNQSDSTPAIAILDTGIDTSLPAFQGKIIQEVCILEWTTCPNGKSFMEGKGSASMPADMITKNGFDHGTFMTSVFLATNPSVNIVFIKIIGNTSAGLRQYAGEASVYNALNWVRDNASKYNIKAVSMSQGHHNLLTSGTDYCPSTPTTRKSLKDLIAMQIPVFFPSGNSRDYSRLDWPACIEDSISVGYVDQQNEISISSNNDISRLDFFAPGFFTIAGPGNVLKNISGSSAAIQVAAAQWIKLQSAKPLYTYDQLLDSLRSTNVSTVGRQGTFKKLISFNDALAFNSILVAAPSAAADAAAAKAAADAATAKAAADAAAAKATADAAAAKATADAAAAKAAAELKAKQIADVNAAIAAAEAQYLAEIKGAKDKFDSLKAKLLSTLS